MDSAAQADGEKRVKRMLVDPLLRRGLVRPSGMTKASFDEMVDDMCAKLAYMTDENLAALEEHAASLPGGKEKDRFPIANRILEWAGDFQQPGDDASPLIRAVFAHQIGKDAIAEGWAPELLKKLRDKRIWPKGYALKVVREEADGSVRRLTILEERLAHGAELTPEEVRWRDRRRAVIAKCERIAEMGAAQAVGGQVGGAA